MSLYRNFPSLLLFFVAIHATSSFEEARVPRKLVKISSDNNRQKPYLRTEYDLPKFSGSTFDFSRPTAPRQSFGSKKSAPLSQPTSTVAVAYEATMKLTIPPPGVSGDSMLAAAFSVAIFATLLPPTLLRTVPKALRIAMVPLWVAGGAIGKRAFLDPYLYTTFSIGKRRWSIKRKFMGFPFKVIKGRAKEVKGAVCEVAGLINGVPKNQLRLVLNNRKDVLFGIELSDKELQVLAENVNEHVEKLKTVKGDVSPSQVAIGWSGSQANEIT